MAVRTEAATAARQRPGQSVRFDWHGKPYQAWVPNRLAPDLAFDAELAANLEDAACALGDLAGSGRTLPNPHLLLRPFLRKEAVLSSKIEGTIATIADVYRYEAAQLSIPGWEHMTPPEDQSLREVINYVRVLEVGIAEATEYPIGLQMILALHRNLMEGVRGQEFTLGQFRVNQNLVGAPGSTFETATYIPPPVLQMRDALESLEAYIRDPQDRYARLVRLALIHYQFEAIHPFDDGNGRVGRLLITLLLVRWNLLPIPLLYMSAYFERNRDAYYDHLRAVTEHGAWRDWLMFFLTGVGEMSRDAAVRATRLLALQRQLRERHVVPGTSAVTQHLMDKLIEAPILSYAGAAQLLGPGIGYHNARRHVLKLVEWGVLRLLDQQGNHKLYIADEVMRVVDQDL